MGVSASVTPSRLSPSPALSIHPIQPCQYTLCQTFVTLRLPKILRMHNSLHSLSVLPSSWLSLSSHVEAFRQHWTFISCTSFCSNTLPLHLSFVSVISVVSYTSVSTISPPLSFSHFLPFLSIRLYYSLPVFVL